MTSFPLPDDHQLMHISANLLATMQDLIFVKIKCYSSVIEDGSVKKMHLIIDPLSFSSSGNSVQYFWIEYCDLTRLDFSFLAELSRLQELVIIQPSGIGMARWDSLPPLPALRHLYIDDSEIASDLNYIRWVDNLPPLSSGLTQIRLIGTGFNGYDEANRIIKWLLNSSSETLEELDIYLWHNLTLLPRHISLFKKLSLFRVSCRNFEINIIEEYFMVSENHHIMILNAAVFERSEIPPKRDPLPLYSEGKKVTHKSSKTTTLKPGTRLLHKIKLTFDSIDCTIDPCHMAWFFRQVDAEGDKIITNHSNFSTSCYFNGIYFTDCYNFLEELLQLVLELKF